jgi:hypothetical protein
VSGDHLWNSIELLTRRRRQMADARCWGSITFNHHNKALLSLSESIIMSSLAVLLGSCANAPEDPAAVLAKGTKELSEARTNASLSSIDNLEFVVNASELQEMYNPMELSAWVSAMPPGATISVHVKSAEGADLQPIHTSFLLAGLSGTSERRETDGSRVLIATKKETISNGAPVTLKNVTLDDTDLIDEDGLLDEQQDASGLLAPPPAISEAAAKNKDDCGGRKACDDCTCGRAELEAGQEPKKEIKTSSCGNCAKGDAFRCASCPYLGLPAFKPGEEHLVLELKDDF